MDGIRVDGPLREWTDIQNPTRRAKYPFPESLRQACDSYYLENYIRWYVIKRPGLSLPTKQPMAWLLTRTVICDNRYNTAPFSIANGQIPQLNIWDDHDVSWPEHPHIAKEYIWSFGRYS